jgi:TetR/AcrR family transcriptional repressor of bet genes
VDRLQLGNVLMSHDTIRCYIAVVPDRNEKRLMQRLDYEEQRHKIALIAADVIAHEGVEAATFRRIAAQAGCSTTLITNHFDDKRDLLVCAYRMVSTNALTRFEQSVLHNQANTIESLVSLTAVDQNSWCGWRVHVAFWAKAIRDPVLASEQHISIENSGKCIENAIQAGYGPGEETRNLAQLLIALVHGISIQVLFEQQSWSRDQIYKALSRQVETTLGRDQGE